MPYSALLHGDTGILLALSARRSSILFVSECIHDATCIHFLNSPSYLKSRFFWQNPFPLGAVSSEEYPKWRWDFAKRKFFPTSEAAQTKEIRAKSALACHKIRAVTEIIGVINISRVELSPGTDLQDTIFLLKKSQAQAYVQRGTEQDLSEFPFVEQYAEIAGISLQQAADDILLKSRINEDKLLRSERMRLKYFDKLKKASTAREIEAVMSEFREENTLNALV